MYGKGNIFVNTYMSKIPRRAGRLPRLGITSGTVDATDKPDRRPMRRRVVHVLWHNVAMAKQVPPGVRGEAEERVEFEHTLTYYNPELPEVYSTPHMIGLMETAAYNALKPFCEEGEISVGTAINVEHRAATTVGALVKAEAELKSAEGRFFVFQVTARALNGKGEVELGRGTVSRAIVNRAKLMARISS